MDDIWPQFHRLPKAIRDAVATPEAIATVDRLEQQYPSLDLAGLIMGVMVKEFPLAQLQAKVAEQGKIDPAAAKVVVETLITKVFGQVGDYLGIKPAAPVPSTPVTPISPSPSPVRPPAAPPAPPLTPPQSGGELTARPVNPTPPKPMSVSTALAIPQPIVPIPSPARPLGNVAPTENYSDDDDQEIAQQTRRVKDIVATTDTVDIDQLAGQVMRQHNLAFRDELLQKRAVSLLKARLKAIRDSEDTKAMLIRAPKVGGLGLDPDLAGNVVTSLDQVAARLTSRGAVRPPVAQPPIPPPVVPKVETLRPAPMPPLTRGLPPENLPTTSTAPLSSFTEQPRMAPPFRRPADIPAPPSMQPPAKPAPRPIPTPVRPSPSLVTRERQPERPAMADISRPNVPAMGPAGEMSSLTLVEFRRLGQGAADSSRRLLDKFRHYQKESFPLWAQAVNGWRQSEVHRIYLDMGRQSLDQGTPISQVIQQRAAAGLPYLSDHEFGTVADLNRQLQL